MSKIKLSPLSVILALIVLIVGTTLFVFLRSNGKRQENLIKCNEIKIGMAVEEVIQVLGEPDDIVRETLFVNSRNLDVIHYVYYGPVDLYKTMDIVFDVKEKAVIQVQCP